MHFVIEAEFDRELAIIEPNPVTADSLLQLIQTRCIQAVNSGSRGLGLVRVFWTAQLISWYQTNGSTTYLLNVRYATVALRNAA